jgi:S-formylglutathione hydrolase FrmB
MKKTLLLLITMLATAGISAQSRVVDATVKSSILGVDKPYSVYLPDGYDTSERDYPVLYLLHGAWGYNRDWVDKGDMRTIADEAIASGRALPMIIVMPDARGEGENYAGKNMGYFNQPDWAYEDFFFGEFIPTIEKTYRIISDKQHRAISGLSMGGGGTAGYAQHHPEMFSSAAPMSGALGTLEVIKQRISPTQFVAGATPEQVEALGTVRWFVDCGDDDYLLDANLDFIAQMRQKKIPLEIRIRNGAHNWPYWRSSLPTVLTFVSTGFADDIDTVVTDKKK